MISKGQKINDRYQIIRTIGEGGMANVYLAYDTILDRNVAVKILRGDLATDDKFVRRFKREAIAASSLSHPNIVEMYDVGEDDGKHFIVMEYLEGKTLKNLIKKRGALTLSEVVDIMLQLTSGLACAHESYIIHRDIKPQNILILDDGRVKITDFGIAVALNSNELTQTNSVMGSVHYLPPEQANGNGATIKSDIYSLGILMFELLTGKLPFKGENAVEIAIKQMKDPIPSVCDINPEIPQSIENIILKATAKNPKNRYETVMEMHEDIKTALDKERANEKKLSFMFSEQEEEKETMTRTQIQEEKRTEEKDEKQNKKINKTLLITGIVAFIITIIVLLIFLLPNLRKVPDVTIPNVKNIELIEAEKQLKKLGFEVDTEVVEKASNDIEEGYVISTSPTIGRTVKKGTLIKLTISKGKEQIKVEDYTGKKIKDVKFLLEEKGLVVVTEDEEVTADDNIEEGTIKSQDIEKGTSLAKGQTITFKVAKLITVYPDFVAEGWTLEKVETFCDDNKITLQSTAKETNDVAENIIVSQSRNAGTKVVAGVTLRVTYAVPKTVVINPSTSPNASTTDSTTTDEKDQTTTDKNAQTSTTTTGTTTE